MKRSVIYIDDKTVKNIDKGNRRNSMMEAGVYNIHKEKVYKDKSKYTRKDKHKNRY